MTTRPGNWAQKDWRRNRTRRPCNLVAVTRTNGVSVYFTDLDRRITFEGNEYRPVVFAGMSAERREAALRSGNQEAYGIIDGTYVLLPDLLGDRYRGAEVRHVITDFANPLLVIARHRKWIRSVVFTGSQFVATLEGRSQVLTRPAGGRFGGTFATTCPYKLGSEFCKVDMGLSNRTQIGVEVSDVIDSRMIVGTDAATYTQTYVDQFFRDGDFTWLWSAPEDSGTITSAITGGSTATVTDSGQSWTTNEWVGKTARIMTPGSGTSGYVREYKLIVSNTSTQLTLAGAWANNWSIGTAYDIVGECANAGVVSPVVGYVNGSRRVELLLPTPFDIELGDSGILRAGCDGLFSTCKTKFSNQLNFGGDPLAPSAGRVIEPAPDQ